MNKKIFSGRTLNQCLKLATDELNIPQEKIKYEIIEDIKGVFNKKVSIKVDLKSEEVSEKATKELNNVKQNEKIENINGSIKIEKGKIIVKNPKKNGRAATLRVISDNLEVFVDDNKIESKAEVYEESQIKILFKENIAQRILNISISPDNMKVFINTEYIPKNIYKIKDVKESMQAIIDAEVYSSENPPLFNKEEIKEELITKGVKFGIMEENIELCTKMEKTNNVLVAKGLEPIDGTDDKIEVMFEMKNKCNKLVEDSTGKVDYKSIGYIKEVRPKDVLAIKTKGEIGRNGLDVKGKIKKHKKGKKITMKAGEGCELKDENTVVSLIEGKPYVNGVMFSVHPVHEVRGDVDISTGNVKFNGDIVIHGNIKEGMMVEAGHNLFIEKNIERSDICAKGNVQAFGNVINSKICSGGEEIVKISKMNYLVNLEKSLEELVNTLENIREHNIIDKSVHDGEVIKLLVENKFKYIPIVCSKYMDSVEKNPLGDDLRLATLIKEKLMDFGPLNIHDYRELSILRELIKKHIRKIQDTLSVPVNMKISYCQDSTLESSGSIYITGKGEYVSNIIASKNVVFENPKSIARGGVIKANDEIKCRSVGSEGGVRTKLVVKENGHIWVEKAYQNTCFVVGHKEYILDIESKDIHVYLDSKGELIVDKFVA